MAAIRKGELVAWGAVASWATLIFATVAITPLLRRWIAENLGNKAFTFIVLACVVLAFLWALATWWRNSRRQWRRLFWLLVFGGALVALAVSLRKNPQEAVHIVQFGVLGVLAFVALSYRIHDPSIYFAAAGVALFFGILDEALQWMIRGRIWDFRDILLNGTAGALALAALAKGVAPEFARNPVKPGSVRITAAIWSVATVAMLLSMINTPERINAYVARFPSLGFLESNASVMVEYGYLHEDPGAGRFRSRFTADELSEIDAGGAERAARLLDRSEHEREGYREFIRIHSPLTDPFLHEARVRLYRRDHHLLWAQKHGPSRPLRYARHMGIVYHENLILERYFGRTLELSRHRLDSGLRAELENYALSAEAYESPVSGQLITRVSEGQVVIALLTALGGILFLGFACGRRRD